MTKKTYKNNVFLVYFIEIFSFVNVTSDSNTIKMDAFRLTSQVDTNMINIY